jgi:(4-O-methyl)-D-glucuronate---lignin esterase
MTGKTSTVSGLTAVLSCTLAQLALAQSSYEPLQRGFISPPQSARPRVWWHWMDGNITKEGIRLDLEWMRRVGLGGFQVFDAAYKTPQVVDRRLPYMTPEWKDAFRYATVLADQLGLEEAIAGSPGWSETGGPWVPASQGMKKYVWSATRVSGGKPFRGKLVPPPAITGPFQNIPLDYQPPPGSQPIPQYYADSVVIAYRRLTDDVPIESLHPKMTASGGTPDFAKLTDGDLARATKLPIPARVGQSAWVQYEFPRAQTIRAVTFVTKTIDGIQAAMDGIGAPDTGVEVSDDGQHFHEVARLARSTGDTGDDSDDAPEYTLAFAPVAAKYFRVTFIRTPPPPPPYWTVGGDLAAFGGKPGPAPTDYEVCELVLHAAARVNRWEEKAAFIAQPDLYSLATPHVEAGQAIAKSDVIDLTSKLQPEGRLDWTPPVGEWVVLRFGYSLLGSTNSPATAEATGLEVDKLDRRFVKQYFDRYLDSYLQTVGPDLMGRKGIRYVINDSWEAGSQNWTDNLIGQFRRHRGYDPLPWMPVLVGQIVESAEASDRFLWDFRKTLADLVAEEHYGQLEATLHERNMGHYGESHEEGRAFVGDGMEVKKFNEVPMGAMWTQTPGINRIQYGYNADDRESASVAHIYGQNIAAAESLTAPAAPWAWSPATLKPTVDQELVNGINRFVIHESAHQPLLDKAPGLTLGPFGQWFNRNETWAEQAGAWVTYLARASFLLQQGKFSADIVYFYGEDSNLTAIFYEKAPDIPAGYGFDYINADGLIHELSVSDGRIVTPGGMSYRVLGLDPYSRHMSLPVLRAIYRLVADGAVVAGPKPEDDPSLADDAAEFRRLSELLFGDGTGIHRVGKGAVYAGSDLGRVFTALKVPADFDYSHAHSDARLLFVHRKLGDGDIYFVANRSAGAESVDASFRVTGRAPELWRAEDGRMEPATFHMDEGRTTVPLGLEPWGTVFVVFAKPTAESSRVLPARTETDLATVEGEWKLSFQPGRGAPASITVNQLGSWSHHADPGVKYFSGVGTYTKSIDVPADWLGKNTQILIDLGEVRNLAEVTLNGKSLGILWHAPYRADATAALRPGVNELSVAVVNAWVNRLIGDRQPGITTPITFADITPYQADSPLLDSGLLGPVTLVGVATGAGH